MYLNQNIIKQNYSLEEFRFSPVGLVPYTKITNFQLPPIEIYSSPKIHNKVIDIVENSIILKPIKNAVIKGILNRKIIVGYTNPSKFKFLYNKIKETIGIKNEMALGFYDIKDDTIYIVLDDNVNIFGGINTKIDQIVAHELCHMIATNNNKTKYLNSVKDILFSFYSNFLFEVMTDIYNYNKNEVNNILNSNKKLLLYFFGDMTKNFEMNKNLDYNVSLKIIFNSWSILLKKLFSKIEKDLNKLNEIADMITIAYNDFTLGKNNNSNINQALINSYEKIGYKNLRTIPGQEVVFLSEVIAITNQTGIDPKIINCINKLNMDK